jgi:excisionase family DNA binding protein
MTAVADDLMCKGSLTVAAAVIEFGIGRSKIYELMEDGALPYAKLDDGGRRLIPRLALERLLSSKMVRTTDAAK